MKPVICVSGIARGNIKRNISRLKEAFPETPIYFSTWTGHKNSISEQYESTYHDEPVIKYNPWLECIADPPTVKYKEYKTAFTDMMNRRSYSHARTQPKLLHHTKQIIGHAYQLEHDITEEYDMIIRARWDTVVSTKVNFNDYLNRSYKENIAIGFAIRGGRHTDINKFKDIDHVHINEDTDHSWSRDWHCWINDPLIFHPRKLFNTQLVHELNEEKRLWPAEYGWYQMLSSMDNHHCVYGGACIERFTYQVGNKNL
tara:strand:- start:3160 stop:3930 length:771 start_codon:yes stop_codon:yes gene_type:complete